MYGYRSFRPRVISSPGYFAPVTQPPSLERGILYLKRACFGLWRIERAILQFEARLFCFMAYRTRNVTFEAR